MRTLERSVLEGFGETFAGELVAPDHEGYEGARAIWNGSIDRRPAVIVRPTGTADVIDALRFAREQDLAIAIRAGGHSIAGYSTCDDGIVIDLGRLKGIHVDPDGRRARVEPGVLWSELDRETQVFGLAVTGGLISSTGVSGFTLGGGIGWLQRRFGLACDNLVSADLVTADGTLVKASEQDDPELLWALRGGGGNFGIVTSMEFALHPVGPQITGGLIFHRGERAAEVLTAFRDLYDQTPDELTLAVVLRLAPPAPFLPESVHGTPVVAIVAVHTGALEDADAALEPIRSLGAPLADVIQPRPYVQMQRLLDASWTPGFRNYWKSEYLVGLPDDAVGALVEHLGTITSPLSDFKMPYLGGAVSRVGEDDTAYGHRDAPFILNVNARWTDPSEDERHIAWTRSLWDSVQPFSDGGTYTNFMSEDDEERVADSFGDATYARLAKVKQRFDPDNVFRLNQNIAPDPGA